MYTLIQLLKQVEKSLPNLLLDKANWNSKDITYHPPHVERLWCDLNIGKYRINLHVIHPCKPKEALIHAHDMPSVVHVLPNNPPYQMGIGYSKTKKAPKRSTLFTLLVEQGGEFWYESVLPTDWHYVAPLVGPTISVTLIENKTFAQSLAPKSPTKLYPLADERVDEILNMFRSHFPVQ